MDKKPLISVIVPVFNCAKYLEESLNSLLLQTYDNIEIICINDGSTDNSGKILEEYAKKDKRIKITHKKNEGQSIARNIGLELATGEWISYIDADDKVSLSLYQKFINTLNSVKKPFDIYMFNCRLFGEKDAKTFSTKFINIKEWNNHTDEYSIHTFDDHKNPFGGNMSAINKIYKKTFLNSLQTEINNKNLFPENLILEDQYFYFLTMLKVKSIIVNPEVLYHYRKSNTVSTMATLGNKVFDIFKILDKIENLLVEMNLYEEYKYAFLQHKFNQFAYLFFRSKLLLKPFFYYKAQTCLNKYDNTNINFDICEKLKGFQLFKDIVTMSFIDFYFEYKNKLKITT